MKINLNDQELADLISKPIVDKFGFGVGMYTIQTTFCIENQTVSAVVKLTKDAKE